MNQFRKNLADNLRSRRGALSQTAFARRIGISQSTLNRIEVAEQNVSVDTLFEICRRLQCTASDLLDA